MSSKYCSSILARRNLIGNHCRRLYHVDLLSSPAIQCPQSRRTTCVSPRISSKGFLCVDILKMCSAYFNPREYCSSSQSVNSTVVQTGLSSENILTSFNEEAGAGRVTPADLESYVMKLEQAVYKELSFLPWLHVDNLTIAFMQITMNNKVNEILGSRYQTENFKSFLQEVERLVPDLPLQSCPQVMLSLLHLGVPSTHPIITRLLLHCVDNMTLLSPHALACLGKLCNSISSRPFPIYQKMIPQAGQFLDEFDGPPETADPVMNSQLIIDLCWTHTILLQMVTKSTTNRWAKHMLGGLERRMDILDVSAASTVVRYARRISSPESRHVGHDMVALVGPFLEQQVGSLTPSHITEIGHNLKVIGVYSGRRLAALMQERSWQLLQQPDIKVRDVVSLMYAFTRDMPPHLERELHQLLTKHMDDADVLILSNFANIILDIGCNDPAILSQYQERVLDNFENLSQYSSQLSKVLRLLSRRPVVNEGLSARLLEEMLRLLSKQQGQSTISLSGITAYILQNVQTVIPAFLMDKLMLMIPQLSLYHVTAVLTALNRMQPPWARKLHNQVLEVRTRLQENISEKLESVSSVETLVQMVQGLYIRSSKRDVVLLERMLSHLPRLTAALTDDQFRQVVNMYRRLLPYFHPEVFENLMTFACSHQEDMTFHKVANLLHCLSRVGYSPPEAGHFHRLCMEKLQSAMDQDDLQIDQVVGFALDLCDLQVFPDSCLGQIFTFEFLEEVDNTIDTRPEQQRYLEETMMMLNRAVVLEAPHLDVPWFHEGLYRGKVAKAVDDPKVLSTLEEEVCHALEEALGGSQYLKPKVLSPYCHHINFQFVLDARGNPVTTTIGQMVESEQVGFQKVAVLVMPMRQFCLNSHHPVGRHQATRRQLEILGYKVIEVPFFDWQSMALADWAAKVEYLRRKIVNL